MRVAKKNWLSELFIATAVAAFVWLFLFAGAYNAITSKPPKERSQSQQTIVRVMSVLDEEMNRSICQGTSGTPQFFSEFR